MAQYYMGLLPFLAVQEAAQWDLRSFFYVYPSVVLFVFLFVVVPVVQILRRTGHNPVWCLVALVPGLTKLPCLLVPRVQAMAHGQEVREYRKLNRVWLLVGGSHRNRFTVSRTDGMRIHYLRSKSKWNFPMKRTALFTLLVALSVAWSLPAKAQSPGVAEYARQSMAAAKKLQKTNRKAAKKQQKAMKKYEKAQRNDAKKEAKKTNRPA